MCSGDGETKATKRCGECGFDFCAHHLYNHDCENSYSKRKQRSMQGSGGIQAEHLEGLRTEKKYSWGDSSKQERRGWTNSEPRTAPTSSSTQSTSKDKGNLIAGAILLATGAVITMTGIGFFIGIPLGMLGFGVMFPRFTKLIVGLATATFLLLILSI